MEPEFFNLDEDSQKIAKGIAILTALLGSTAKIVTFLRNRRGLVEKPEHKKTLEERVAEMEAIIRTWTDTLPNIKEDVSEGKEDNKYLIKQLTSLIGMFSTLRAEFQSELTNMRNDQRQTRTTVDQLLIATVQQNRKEEASKVGTPQSTSTTFLDRE